jgi:hypothetical protein
MNPNNDMKGALRSKENLFLEAMKGTKFHKRLVPICLLIYFHKIKNVVANIIKHVDLGFRAQTLNPNPKL